MNVDAVRGHFERRLEAAELVRRPFPHLIVTDALPTALYREAIAVNPFVDDPGRPFGDPAWTDLLVFEHTYDRRFQLDLDPDHREVDVGPWSTIGDAFADPSWLGPVLRRRHPEYFEFRFGDIDAIERDGSTAGFWSRLHTRAFLQRHEPGFRLDAHTDIPTRIATCIFSLPVEPGHEDAGTRLLEPLDPRWRCTGNSHHPIDGFRVVTIAPYAPNTCLVFFKTRDSWHSVPPEAATVPGGRFGMQVQLYEPDEGAVLDLSAPDLVRNGQFRDPTVATRVRRKVRSMSGAARRRLGATGSADAT